MEKKPQIPDGRAIDPYRILEPRGQGGMGGVYKAVPLQDGPRLVLVQGQSGAGKTRLLMELSRQVGHFGVPVLSGEGLFGWNAVPRHGGSHSIHHPDGHPITARAGIVRLPGGYHAVALVNPASLALSMSRMR